MLSIIVCSKFKTLPKSFVDSIANTIGTDYEIVHVDNSENKYSIFSAYNEGARRSKFPNLCFVHEDVLFRSNGWGEKIIDHLKLETSGIFGVAGGAIVTRVPASWIGSLSSVNIIQSDKTGRKRTKKVFKPKKYSETLRSAILLDGVMLCMKRSLMEKIKFDENIPGFHGYDLDICIQSTVAGYTNYVMYDVLIEHLSRGNRDGAYFRNLIQIFKKWEKHLPIFGDEIPEKKISKLNWIEEIKLYKLLIKLSNRGFSRREISDEINYYGKLLDSKIFKFILRNLDVFIFIIRSLYFPNYLHYKRKQ